MYLMIENTVCSTLSGKLAVKHAFYNVLIREDGKFFARVRGGRVSKSNAKYHWVAGSKDGQGYMKASITIDNVHCYPTIHRLVAECFIFNPDPLRKRTVDHINRICDDNRKENLRWASQREQIENRAITETSVQKYGVRSCVDKKAYMKAYGKLRKRRR